MLVNITLAHKGSQVMQCGPRSHQYGCTDEIHIFAGVGTTVPLMVLLVGLYSESSSVVAILARVRFFISVNALPFMAHPCLGGMARALDPNVFLADSGGHTHYAGVHIESLRMGVQGTMVNHTFVIKGGFLILAQPTRLPHKGP